MPIIISRNKPISIRMPDDLMNQAKEEAKRRRLTFSGWLKMLMQDELDRQKDKHPTKVTAEEKQAIDDGLKGLENQTP